MQRTVLVWLLMIGTVALALIQGMSPTAMAAAQAQNTAGNTSDAASNSSKSEGAKANAESPSPSDSKNSSSSNVNAASSKPSTQKADPDPEYQSALDHLKAKRYKEAGKILKLMARDDSKKDKANLVLGTVLFRMKKLKNAKKYFDRVAEPVLTRDNAYAYGSTYLEFEDYSKALKGLRANLKLKGPSRDLTRFKVGVCYYKRAQYARAERYLDAAKSKSLPKTQRLQRRRYLAEIRQRNDELLSSFGMMESDERSLNALPAEFGGGDSDDEWADNLGDGNWDIRWKPGAMLKQESNQSINRAHGRDSSDLIVHRVGLKGYAGGDPNSRTFGGIEFGMGFAGYEVKTEQSRSFTLPGISGEFLSETKQEKSEENVFVTFQPLISIDVSPAVHAEIGAGYVAMLPHAKMNKGWGQSEVTTRLRAEGKEIDGGFEIALQQPFDQDQNILANESLVKADVNQRLGDMSLRLNVQDWRTDNTKFRAFDRNRMMMVDSRFRYHLGFESESKLGVSGAMTFGELGIRASYDYTTRNSDGGLERLDAVDNPETIAKEANKRMFAISFPIWDAINIIAAAGTQNLSGYTFRLRDSITGAVTKEYTSDVKQTLFQFTTQVSLVDWVKVRLNYSVEKNKYISRSAEDEVFQSSNPRANENSIMHIELSKSF